MVRERRWTGAVVAATMAIAVVGCSSESVDGAGGPGLVGGASGTGGEGASAAGGATSGGGQGQGGEAGAAPSCATSLAERLTVTTVDVSPASIATVGFWSFADYSFFASPTSSGAKIAWLGSDQTVHVTPVDSSGARSGADAIAQGGFVRGHVARDDGSALLIVRDDTMQLVILDAAGNETAATIIVGGGSHDQEGDKWIDSWSDNGRLASNGSLYGAYFGHTGNWGSQGNHQGDWLGFFDSSGAPQAGGWGWGCSHSIDVRLTATAAGWAPVCISDCYPAKGIVIDNSRVLRDEPSGNCSGLVDASLGGLVARSDGLWLTFQSREGRASQDIGLLRVTTDETLGPYWLTDTSTEQELSAHLAAYGDGLLAGWMDSQGMKVAVVGADGQLVQGPEAVPARAAQRDDFVVLADGTVLWAFGESGNPSEMKIARMRPCE